MYRKEKNVTKISNGIKGKIVNNLTKTVSFDLIRPTYGNKSGFDFSSIIKPDISSASIKRKAKKIMKNASLEFDYYKDLTIDLLSFYNVRKESVIGVDITPSCIYLCQIDGLNGKRVLTSLTSVCMEGKFVTEDIVNNADDYADSLKTLIKENNIESKNVALSIPVSSSIVKVVTIPRMNDDEIKHALKVGSLWNNFMQSDKNPDDYSIFYQVLRRSHSSDTMDIIFTATKLSDISLYTDIVKNSGLNPVIVDARCFAISRAFQHKMNNPDANCGASLFLEFGMEENYAMIINGDISNIFDISVSDAHRAALIGHELDAGALDEFVADYSAQVERIVCNYEEKHNIRPIKNAFVISTAPTANTIVDKLVKSLDNYTVLECNFFDCMKIYDDFTISAKSAKQNLSAWAGAIGNALRKVDVFAKAENNNVPHYNNLLPDAGSYETQKRSGYFVNACSAVASVAMLLFVIYTQGDLAGKNGDLSKELAQYDGVQEKYDISYSRHNKLQNIESSVDEVASLIKDVQTGHDKLMAVHKYLNLVILEDVWLKELSFDGDGKFEISGGATQDQSILEFIELLDEGEQFAQVSLRGMREIREQRFSDPKSKMVKSFKLDGEINPTPIQMLDGDNMMADGDTNKGS